MATASATCRESSTTSITCGPDGLGVDAIWLSPIYPSPGRDLGYDVSDHASDRPAVRHRRPTSTGWSRRRTPRHPGRPRPGHEPHQRRASAGSPLARVADRARSPTGISGATPCRTGARRRVRCRRTTGSRSSAARAGSGTPAAGSSTSTRSCVEQPELNWRAPAVEEAQFAMVRGWLERGVDGFRLDVFNAFLKDPRAALEPAPRSGRRPWDRQVHRVRPGPAGLPGAHRPVPGDPRRPSRADVGRRAVRRHGRRRRAELSAPTPPRLRLGADRAGLERRRRSAPRSPGARRPSAPTAGRPSCCRTTTSRATRSRLAASAGGGRRRRGRHGAAAVLLLTLRGTPFLYYGEELGLGDVTCPPVESVDRPAARAAGPGFDVVGPLAAAGRRCRGRPGPGGGLHHRPAVAAPGADVGDPQRRGPGRPTRTRSCRRYRRADRARAGATRRSRSALLGTSPGDRRATSCVYARETADQRRRRR